MSLSDFRNLSETEKLSKFDGLFSYVCEIYEENFNLKKEKVKEELILKAQIKKEVTKEVTDELKAKYDKKLADLEFIEKKLSRTIKSKARQAKKAANWKYRDSQIDYDKKKLEIEQNKISIIRGAIEDLATLRRKKQPILWLSPSDWEIRKKVYPMILNNPADADSTLAKKAWTTPSVIVDAKDELTLSWDLLNSKIDLVKRIVTRAAMTTEKAQEILLKRLIDNPNSIQIKDLLAAIKNNSALYSMMVWGATDTNWGILADEDNKMLQEVLSKNLKFNKE